MYKMNIHILNKLTELLKRLGLPTVQVLEQVADEFTHEAIKNGVSITMHTKHLRVLGFFNRLGQLNTGADFVFLEEIVKNCKEKGSYKIFDDIHNKTSTATLGLQMENGKIIHIHIA
jgi:hypothetical protein